MPQGHFIHLSGINSSSRNIPLAGLAFFLFRFWVGSAPVCCENASALQGQQGRLQPESRCPGSAPCCPWGHALALLSEQGIKSGRQILGGKPGIYKLQEKAPCAPPLSVVILAGRLCPAGGRTSLTRGSKGLCPECFQQSWFL